MKTLVCAARDTCAVLVALSEGLKREPGFSRFQAICGKESGLRDIIRRIGRVWNILVVGKMAKDVTEA